MSPLNEPIDYDRRRRPAWTPQLGLRRAAAWGGLTAVLLAVVLAPLAAKASPMVLPLWTRIPLAFGVIWVLFKVVQRAAGMVGPSCSALAVGLGALVLLSNHVIFATAGVPTAIEDADWWFALVSLVGQIIEPTDDLFIGPGWFHPLVLLLVNLVPLLFGGGIAMALCRQG